MISKADHFDTIHLNLPPEIVFFLPERQGTASPAEILSLTYCLFSILFASMTKRNPDQYGNRKTDQKPRLPLHCHPFRRKHTDRPALPTAPECIPADDVRCCKYISDHRTYRSCNQPWNQVYRIEHDRNTKDHRLIDIEDSHRKRKFRNLSGIFFFLETIKDRNQKVPGSYRNHQPSHTH